LSGSKISLSSPNFTPSKAVFTSKIKPKDKGFNQTRKSATTQIIIITKLITNFGKK